jgi:pimeloyl-ACP methyl ester carboxylesterase
MQREISAAALGLVVALTASSFPITTDAQTRTLTSTEASQPSATIADRTLDVSGQTFRYLAAGQKPRAIVLVHGWPQTADEFRAIIPDLARDYTVYAPDLSGIGGTTAPQGHWDKASLAKDLKSFIDAAGIKRPLIVGHDIGGMVAYAYGRLFPDDVAGVAVLDVPIPGLAPWDQVAASPQAWHFDFHAQPGLAEKLVAGREKEYIRYFLDKVSARPGIISDAAVETYAKAYGTPDRLRAGFELYRSFREDAAFFQTHATLFAVPMLAVGAEFSTGPALPIIAKSYADHGVSNLQAVAIPASGHWLVEEQPAATLKAIEDFAAMTLGR